MLKRILHIHTALPQVDVSDRMNLTWYTFRRRIIVRWFVCYFERLILTIAFALSFVFLASQAAPSLVAREFPPDDSTYSTVILYSFLLEQ